MQRTETNHPNVKSLRRMLALLLALAEIAERTVDRAPAVRFAVLWLLLPGEAIARDYIVRMTGDWRVAERSEPAADPIADYSPTGAMRLADAYRMLAAVLATFALAIYATRQSDCMHDRTVNLERCLAGILWALRPPMPAAERLDSS